MPTPKTIGGYRKGSGRGKHGWYDMMHFDSTYELAYYIYCKQHDMNIERCTNTFEYINSNGEKRTYHPDFRVNGKIVEIKGYKDKDVDLKIQSVTEPIELLLPNDLKPIFEFVEKYTNIKIEKLHKLYCNKARCTPDGARSRNLPRERRTC